MYSSHWILIKQSYAWAVLLTCVLKLASYSTFALWMPFSCQEWSYLRSKQANQISDYVVTCYITHSVIILWKMASLQDSHFYTPGKTIHSQVKYSIMDYCDQEAKNLLVSCLCYGTMLSSFVVGLSEWIIMKIHADYRKKVIFSCLCPMRCIGMKLVWL